MHRTARPLAIAAALCTPLLGLAPPAESQPAPVPFAVGETADYQVKLGGIAVGSGSFDVLGIESVNGHDSYRTRLHVRGGIPFARVDTRMESWIDVDQLLSRRFEQDQHEINFKRHRIFDFYPESRSYRLRGSNEVGRLASAEPLDDLSFIYFARTLPLRVGDTYTVPRYFRADGNPVVIRVLRKQEIEVPAGTFQTIVVQPIIQTDGLFGKGGQAELYFSDDARRILVSLRSRVPLVGSLSLNLRSYQPGTP